jgi:hypothetical protein
MGAQITNQNIAVADLKLRNGDREVQSCRRMHRNAAQLEAIYEYIGNSGGHDSAEAYHATFRDYMLNDFE